MSFGSWFLFQCSCRVYEMQGLKAEQRAFPCIQRNTCKETQYSRYSTTHSQPPSSLSWFKCSGDLQHLQGKCSADRATGDPFPTAWTTWPGASAPSGEGESCLHVFESLLFPSSYLNTISCQRWRNYQKALISAHLISSSSQESSKGEFIHHKTQIRELMLVNLIWAHLIALAWRKGDWEFYFF